MDDQADARIEQWFLAYSSDIYRFLAYYTGRKDIDDPVQETFIRVLGSLLVGWICAS